MDIFLIGHRTSGKTTLARALGLLHPHLFEIVDLDDVIEHEEERTCAEIIADHEPYFRELERSYLEKILAAEPSRPHRIIVPGAGCTYLPHGPLYVWLRRDGWIESASTQRARLRARRSFEEEVSWMRRTREPRWAAHAHTLLTISRGAQLEHTIQRLSELVLALLQAPESPTIQKSWLVPHDEASLERAIHDQPTLGFAGIEMRSDFFPEHVAQLAAHAPILASLRTADGDWFARVAPLAHMLDVDVELIESINQSIFDTLTKKTFILSTHPVSEAPDVALARLVEAAQAFLTEHPSWQPYLTLKFAPTHASTEELLTTLEAVLKLSGSWRVTYLPQGTRHAWMRPWLVSHLNHTNYIPVTLHAATTDVYEAPESAQSPASLDLHQWLPHLASDPPTTFDALLGDPVAHSVGDWWHRMAALRAHTPHLGYLKIPVPGDLDAAGWRHLLSLLSALNMRGLSITSPHKRTVFEHEDVSCVDEDAHEAINTLVHHSERGWLGIDTDHVGMIATLDALTERGVTPGDVLIIGQGGVSAAVRRAFEAREAWTLVHHASAREGWTPDAPHSATLIINAAGDHDSPYINPPACTAWVDLHYVHVRTPPACDVHLNGEIFFVAQAAAQRSFWASTAHASSHT